MPQPLRGGQPAFCQKTPQGCTEMSDGMPPERCRFCISAVEYRGMRMHRLTEHPESAAESGTERRSVTDAEYIAYLASAVADDYRRAAGLPADRKSMMTPAEYIAFRKCAAEEAAAGILRGGAPAENRDYAPETAPLRQKRERVRKPAPELSSRAESAPAAEQNARQAVPDRLPPAPPVPVPVPVPAPVPVPDAHAPAGVPSGRGTSGGVPVTETHEEAELRLFGTLGD